MAPPAGERTAIAPFGDAAVLVRLGDGIDEAVNRRVHRLAEAVEMARAAAGAPSAGAAALHPAVPAYASLLVPFDPLATTAAKVSRLLRELLADLDERVLDDAPEQPPIEIGVRYGGADGPDLAEVAERTGLRPADVIETHSAVAYRAFMLGFAPGFAYLGQLPAALELPRRDSPRQRVPAGSVAIAGRQTAIYPSATAGGWHLIGRTEAAVWDVRREPPALIAAGRRVRFVPV